VLAAGFYGSSKSNYDIAIKDFVSSGVSPLELITQKPL
jgi:hypothetical protein